MNDDRSVIVLTNGGAETVQRPRRSRRKHLRKGKATETHISTINLQHLSIGFGMSIKIQSPTLDTGEAIALWKKFQKMKHTLSKISAIFCHLFTLCLMILIQILTILTLISQGKKENVKESLHKNLEHWHHIDPNPSVIYTIENGYSRFNNFVL